MLSKHVLEQHSAKTYPCAKCSLHMGSVEELKSHMKSCHDMNSYYCDKCEYETPLFAQQWEHNFTAHQQTEDQCNPPLAKDKIAYSMIAEQNIDIFNMITELKNNMNDAFADMKSQIETSFADIKQECSNYQKSFEITGNAVAKLSAKVDQIVRISEKTVTSLEENVWRKPKVSQPHHQPVNNEVKGPRTISDVTIANDDGKQAPIIHQDMRNKARVLVVGDSITHNSNFRLLEEATNTVVHTAKAYAADFDVNSRFPNKNFKYVARNSAKKRKFNMVLMQSPSVDLTNLNTADNSIEAVESYKKVIEKATSTMFQTANTMIEENQSIEKVIILDRTPRIDTKTTDPFGLKAKLAEYGNKLNQVELENTTNKAKIMIGKHNFSCNEETFGNENDRKFDGIHMHGPRGSEGYTRSLISILSDNLNTQPEEVVFNPTIEKSKNRSKSTPKPTNPSSKVARPANPSFYQYAVNTLNRFSTLLN